MFEPKPNVFKFTLKDQEPLTIEIRESKDGAIAGRGNEIGVRISINPGAIELKIVCQDFKFLLIVDFCTIIFCQYQAKAINQLNELLDKIQKLGSQDDLKEMEEMKKTMFNIFDKTVFAFFPHDVNSKDLIPGTPILPASIQRALYNPSQYIVSGKRVNINTFELEDAEPQKADKGSQKHYEEHRAAGPSRNDGK